VTVAVADLVTLPLDERLAPAADLPPDSRESPALAAVIAEARAGCPEAFGRLVALHERAVFRAAMAALGSTADAEDAAQEALLVAWCKLPTFRGESQFRTWLLTIVWRKALDRRRRRARWWLGQDRSTGGRARGRDTLADLPAAAADPEAGAIASDTARRIRREIRGLSPKLRDTLLLAAGGEYSYPEIAAMLGVPLGTVKWRVAEARRLIAARVGGPL